jgi:peptide deformylase
MIYELIPPNSPILKQELENFDFSNSPVNPLDLVTDLAETMLASNGIGLSANQVGLPYRVFVMYGDELIPCFNPRIVDMSTETVVMEEGCLSYPDLFVKVKRPRRIKVRYTEPNGQTVTRVFDGITARVFQHELDHLNGVNYQQRANKLHLEQARKKKKKTTSSLSTQAHSAIGQLNI